MNPGTTLGVGSAVLAGISGPKAPLSHFECYRVCERGDTNPERVTRSRFISPIGRPSVDRLAGMMRAHRFRKLRVKTTYSLKQRVTGLEQMAAQVCGPPRLDVVDVLTPMDLATLYDGTEDDGELWHRVRGKIDVEDDGSGEGRIAAIEAATGTGPSWPAAPGSR